MNIQFDVFKKYRQLILKEIEGLTLEQLHVIPDGFNNNIAWNVAHLVVTQQLLNYKLSGLNCLCPDDLIENFKKGTVPTVTFTEEEFEEVLELFTGLPDTFIEDYSAGIFENFTTYSTSAGLDLNSIEDAITFNNFHEGLHYATIKCLKKSL
ncbi:DinB family protein [Polaribacter sargassicola]|uniref:DinB family protein n=1 Tax=Polaribacter sargassicola TaxID=2836891 RepID=UPI001F2DF977|nr:DinB family protein [Polaribacter sp. DS7-9]MCG1037547.1 DinB family protein [Polaribacter sp. DS7-9]